MTTRVDPAETAAVFSRLRAQVGAHNIDADIGGIAEAVITFEKVEKFTTFMAEFAVRDGAIIVHFFPPREAHEVSLATHEPRVTAEFLRFWKKKFPWILSPVAENFFKAGPPLLTATYIEEMTSWYMRVGGYAGRDDAADVIMRFFEVLDSAVDAA